MDEQTVTEKPGAVNGVAGDRLLSLIERVERVQQELAELNADKSEIYKEAKSTGFEPKVMKEIIKRRSKGKDEAEEADSLRSIYERAIENAETLRRVSHVRAREAGADRPAPARHIRN